MTVTEGEIKLRGGRRPRQHSEAEGETDDSRQEEEQSRISIIIYHSEKRLIPVAARE